MGGGKISINRALTALAAVVAVALLLWLLSQTQAVDVSRHNQRLAELRALQDADGKLNVEILKARLDLDVESDALDDIQQQIGTQLVALDSGPRSLRGLAPAVDASLAAYEAAMRDKLALTARFEPGNLQLINGLDAIPRIGDTLLQNLAEPRYAALRQLIVSLRGELMTYGVLPEATNSQAVQSLVYDLGKQVGAVPAASSYNFLKLGTLSNDVLSNKAAVKDLVARLLAAPVPAALERLSAAYGTYYQGELARANHYRAALAAYAALLLLALALLGLRLRNSYRDLDRANETLEAQVEQRTHDLSAALDKLRASQALLVQSEKMASLGQMVAGVAHEINTPLAYARSNIDLLSESLDKLGALIGGYEQAFAVLNRPGASDADLGAALAAVAEKRGRRDPLQKLAQLRELLDDSHHGLGQIAELVLNLKDFSRVDRSASESFDVNSGIDSALKICRNMLKDRVEVVKHYGRLPPIECAPSQLNQVFLNILTNASQAIAGNGRIYIHTRPERDGVMVRIIDTGCGMSDEVRARIFEPFFTTKDVGKGTGLGLSIVYRIVQNHGGDVEVRSAAGKGSEFSIYLPGRRPAAAEAPAAAMPAMAGA